MASVHAIVTWDSHVGSTNLASKARAAIPAAKGADALVPVCLLVHWFFRSVVMICKWRWWGGGDGGDGGGGGDDGGGGGEVVMVVVRW